MLEISHRAMACEFVVMVAGAWASHDEAGAPPRVADVVLRALEAVDALESKLSVYRDESEIMCVNRSAFEHPVEVSPETFEVLTHARAVHRITEGAMDITAGPLVDLWGFQQRQGRKPSDAGIAEAREKVGMESLLLDPERRAVSFLVPGMSLNLGAIGKGFAIDQMAAYLTRSGIRHFLIHAGSSSVFACGDQSGRALDSANAQTWGWRVGVAHPTKPDRRVAGVWLRDEALSTSGSGKQFFHHQGKRYGHVIDPRTGRTAGDLLSLSVVTPTATIADAASTGLFVLGRDKAEAIGNQQGWPMLMVGAGERQDEVEIRVSGDWKSCED